MHSGLHVPSLFFVPVIHAVTDTDSSKMIGQIEPFASDPGMSLGHNIGDHAPLPMHAIVPLQISCELPYKRRRRFCS